MVDNLHFVPSWGIINNNHPFFGSSLLGTAALIRVSPIRVLQERIRLWQVCAWDYSIRQHSAWSPGATTSFVFVFLLCSEVCAFFGAFTVFYPLMVSISIFPQEKRFWLFSSEYLLFTSFYSFEEGYLSNYIQKSIFLLTDAP